MRYYAQGASTSTKTYFQASSDHDAIAMAERWNAKKVYRLDDEEGDQPTLPCPLLVAEEVDGALTSVKLYIAEYKDETEEYGFFRSDEDAEDYFTHLYYNDDMRNEPCYVSEVNPDNVLIYLQREAEKGGRR